MNVRFIGLAACALFGFAAGAFAQPVAPQSEREAYQDRSGWAYVVINLRYADAEEIALVLRQVLPPTIRVIPYSPTNSLLIAGDPAILEVIEKRGIEEQP